MTLEQQLLMDLHALPPEQQAEVADFAAFLRYRRTTARVPQSTGEGLQPLPVLNGSVPGGWKDAIYDPE
jgi:hypothetical protein